MTFKPHILQVLSAGTSTEDGNGNPIVIEGGYVTLCECRCDDNGQLKQVGVGGQGIVYNYHIVFEKREKIKEGTKVKVLNQDLTVRGEGTVIKNAERNALNYSEIWL